MTLFPAIKHYGDHEIVVLSVIAITQLALRQQLTVATGPLTYEDDGRPRRRPEEFRRTSATSMRVNPNAEASRPVQPPPGRAPSNGARL
jgi:hypothetical protein